MPCASFYFLPKSYFRSFVSTQQIDSNSVIVLLYQTNHISSTTLSIPPSSPAKLTYTCLIPFSLSSNIVSFMRYCIFSPYFNGSLNGPIWCFHWSLLPPHVRSTASRSIPSSLFMPASPDMPCRYFWIE
jgi:hypothetical protein